MIAPGEEADLIAELKVATPGAFEAPMVVYVEHRGLQELSLTVTGKGVADGEQQSTPP